MSDLVRTPTTPPAEWDVIVRQAEILAQSDIVPGAYRRKPANIIAAAISGRAFGWDAMAAMRNGHVIEGQYTIKPEAQVGLVRTAGHSLTGHTSDTEAVAVGKRGDSGDEMTVTWTIADAQKAGLASRKVWEQYPASMLWARAVSQLCRMLFPDVTLGLSYTPDEIGEVDFASDDVPVPVQVDPPEGWDDWADCDLAHEHLRADVKAAPAEVRRKWDGYLHESGYGAPFTRWQLEELDAQLLIFTHDSAHREVPTGGTDANGDPILALAAAECALCGSTRSKRVLDAHGKARCADAKGCMERVETKALAGDSAGGTPGESGSGEDAATQPVLPVPDDLERPFE